MATETTKTDKTEETGTDDTTTLVKDADTGSDTSADTGSDDVLANDDSDADAGSDDVLADDDSDIATAPETGVRAGGFGAGAGAVVSAALGLASLTGTSLSEMLRERKQMIGQIEASAQQQGGGGSAADQITAAYGAPWHATALFNGVFALLAVVVGGVLLAMIAKRADTRSWVKSLALGGLILGLIGLLVAGGMYFDLFASPPELPSQPS